LDFVLEHVNDLDAVIKIEREEVMMLPLQSSNGKVAGIAAQNRERNGCA
jgi:hypothetical protein